jgi:predicted transcriptional regulator
MQRLLRQKINAYLKTKGITRNRLADTAKVHPSILYRFLDGQSITMRTAEKIERAMK